MNSGKNSKKRKIFINYDGVGFLENNSNVNFTNERKTKIQKIKKYSDISEKSMNELTDNLKELHIR
jgi:hypothetical protein